MNIQELADRYELQKDDFWELRKGSGKWIITNDACEKIASIEGIIFEQPQVINYEPTIITENGEKVQQVKWGKQFWKPAWAGTCQKKTGDVAMIITGYKLDNPDYKIWSTGEANGENCTMGYRLNIAEKRGKNRVTLKLINAYEYGIYSDIESDEFIKADKPASEKQIDMLHNLAMGLGIELMGVDKMNKEEASTKIDELKERKLTQEAEQLAREKENKHGI